MWVKLKGTYINLALASQIEEFYQDTDPTTLIGYVIRFPGRTERENIFIKQGKGELKDPDYARAMQMIGHFLACMMDDAQWPQ